MNRVCSIFSQLLQLFPRAQFEARVREHKAERHARGFSCWSQFVAMLFCHMGHDLLPIISTRHNLESSELRKRSFSNEEGKAQ